MSTQIIITTTPSIEGKSISRYHGLVVGEAILGANIFRALFAGIRDIVGGRSAAYEQELQKARRIALTKCASRRATSARTPSSVSIWITKSWDKAER